MAIKTILLGLFFTLPLIILCGSSAVAETVYRSVNEKGEVIYSSEPVEGAESTTPVTIQPGPSQADIEEAKQRVKKMQRAAEKGQSQRDQQQRKSKKLASDQAGTLAEAEKALQEAKVIRDSDWQFLAKGGRHLKPEYFERVEKAKAEYEALKKSMR